MKSIQLNSSRALVSLQKAFVGTLAILAIAAHCQTVFGQTGAPIAHMVSERSVAMSKSRARTVGSSKETVPAAAEAESALSIRGASSIERRAFDRTNDERAKIGLPRLVWDSELCRMARIHSENMARLGFFAHETPEGMRLKERARSMGIQHFRVIAENIAYNKGYDDPGAFAVERWMISAGHRANILYVGFQASAIGSYVSKDGSVYLTQVFINR